MKLSTKARYGMKAMVDLALHYEKGPVLLKDIAKGSVKTYMNERSNKECLRKRFFLL